MNPGFFLDLVVSVMLLWLAWALLSRRDLFRGIVLFIAFGMVLSIGWVRLGAPDVALAEAGIGAGVTGALLLATWGSLRRRRESGSDPDPPEDGENAK